MSTKEWVYEQDNPDIGCYQEITLDDDINNPAVIQVNNPEEFSIAKTEFSEQLTVAIPAEVFDKIAIAWCHKRKLQGELGGPVGLELGSPDSPYK
jgi:hypothetical protein